MADRLPGVLGVLLAMGASAAAAQPNPWPAAATNPRPAPGDLVLPLPCGGSIAFRPVPVPAGRGMLADREVMLGQPDAEANYAEFLRRTFIAGAFPGRDAAEPPRIYIGKYEVTRDQFAAVMAEDGACPAAPSATGRLPQADVAWHEAAGFAARLSRHLNRAARDRLPRDGEAVTFVRLPTEDEWEFAARGGTAVEAASFEAPTYPMAEGMASYEYFQGARSADGRARPAGELRPNPLGLHDMLGNVAEWALEGYRLNRIGRPHGLAGGHVARGGHFRVAEDEMRASLRIEHPPVRRTDGELTRLPTVGFRVVLTRETVTSPAATRQLSEEFTREAEARDTQLGAADPSRLLAALRAAAADDAARSGLDRLGAAMQDERRARREQETASLRGRIEASAYLARQIWAGRGVVQIMTVIRNVEQERLSAGEASQAELTRLAQAAATPEMRRRLGSLAEASTGHTQLSRRMSEQLGGAFLPAAEQRLRELGAQYISSLVPIGRGADPQRLAAEAAVVIQDFETRRDALLPPIARVVARHLDTLARGGNLEVAAVVTELGAVREAPAAVPAR